MTGIRWVESVDSTNSVLVESPIEHGAAVATLHQTSGRGRNGREWITVPGRGLAISLALTWTEGEKPERLTRVPLVAGAALIEAIRALTGSAASWMKWPNDVYIGELKVAGILTEMPKPNLLIVGMGVNVSHNAEEIPFDTATSLAIEGIVVDAPALATEWRRRVLDAIDSLDSPGTLEWLGDNLGLVGEKVRVEFPDATIRTGIVRGIDDDGALLLDGGIAIDRIVAADITRLRRDR